MNKSNLENAFEKMDIKELPAIVPMSPEQSLYLTLISKRMREVIENKQELDEADPLFGKGEYFWPKDPRKPIKSALTFDAENFKFRTISLHFNRKNTDSAWGSAVLIVHPRNFPAGVFGMSLPDSFFSDMTLLRAYSEKREHESIKEVNVFEYASRQNNSKIKLRFEARPDVSDVREKYPRSFHTLFIDSVM